VRVKLDLTPPWFVITNPTNSTVSVPVIQLQGYIPETLAKASYDLNNASGLVTNQSVTITGQYYDPNNLAYTTNYFQCFDVPLALGLNTITLHGTDLAGDVTTTNFSFTLGYAGATNPPTVVLNWPLPGMQISGGSFIWHGWVSEPTATVIAQTLSGGVTNAFTGQVGRDGTFWIAGLPLSGGTNQFTLTATDAAGNSTSTNLAVVQSPLALAITSAPWGQPIQGTISDPNDYTIWVNGVQATNNGDGTWIVQNPILTLNTPVAQVRAIPNSENGGNGTGGGTPSGSGQTWSSGNPSATNGVDAETEMPWPDCVVYDSEYHHLQGITAFGLQYVDYLNWQETAGGVQTAGGYHPDAFGQEVYWSDDTYCNGACWPDSSTVYYQGTTNEAPAGYGIPYDDPIVLGIESYAGPDNLTYSMTQDATVTLITGGGAGATGSELIEFSAQGASLTVTNFATVETAPVYTPVPPRQISIGSYGNLDTNHNLYALVPQHAQLNITPGANGPLNSFAPVVATPITILPQCIAYPPINQIRSTIGVGEEVNVSVNVPLSEWENVQWSTTAGSLDGTNGVYTTFTAPSYASKVIVTAKVNGLPVSTNFNVVAPSGVDHALIIATNNFRNCSGRFS
jgi:hypothetical protein